MWVGQADFAYLGKSVGASGHEEDDSEVIDKRLHHLQRPVQATSAAIADEPTDIAANA